MGYEAQSDLFMNEIYRISYNVPGDNGRGLAFLDNGRIYGGDISHAFYGDYQIDANTITAKVTRIQHGQGYPLGGGGSELTISGKVEDGRIAAQGSISGSPAAMTINMQRIASL